MKTDNVFKTHPMLKSYHKTSDGTAFFQETDAKNHAKSLEDKTIEKVFNPELIEVEVEEVSVQKPEAAKKKASGKKKVAAVSPKAQTPQEKKEVQEPKQD